MKLYTNQDKLIFWGNRIKTIKEKPKPISLVASLTGRCNWNCDFCYLRDQKSIDLDYDKLIKFIDSLPIAGIEITGGEPTLYKKINELIEYCYDKGIKLGMTTNGSMITDQMRISGKCPIKEENLEKFSWIRISINWYHKNKITPTWSFKNPFLGLNLIYYKGLENNLSLVYLKTLLDVNPSVRYLRISLDRNCDQHTKESYLTLMNHHNNKWEKIKFRPTIDPCFFEGECYCGFIKPILEWDGKIYNCISELEMYGHDSPIYITDIDHPEKLLEYPKNRELRCKYCYYKDRNYFVEFILKGFHKEFL